jgi:hypothetical protein
MSALHPVVTHFPTFARAITPSDSAPLRGHDNKAKVMTVYAGTEGDVVVVPVGQDESQPVTFKVPAGGLVPVEVTHVFVTGTTATDLVGLY